MHIAGRNGSDHILSFTKEFFILAQLELTVNVVINSCSESFAYY